MATTSGRSPADAGSGHSAKPEPISVVSAETASVPNADAEFDRVMDTLQLIISIKEGHTLTQQEADDIRFLEAYYREQDERAVEAFDRGYQYGLKRGGGADTAKLIEERDSARSQTSITNALASAGERWAFINGAQVCREMMARFIEQDGSSFGRNVAASIRANWRHTWGEDPGAPDEEKYVTAAPREISTKAEQIATTIEFSECPVCSATPDSSEDRQTVADEIETEFPADMGIGSSQKCIQIPDKSERSA